MNIYDYYRYNSWSRLHQASLLYAFNYEYGSPGDMPENRAKIKKIPIYTVGLLKRQEFIVKDARPEMKMYPENFFLVGDTTDAVNTVQDFFNFEQTDIQTIGNAADDIHDAIDEENRRQGWDVRTYPSSRSRKEPRPGN